MMILSVTLFLRSSEVVNIKYSQFIPELFIRDRATNQITALAIKIKGKCDRGWTILMIYRNDRIPKLCPVTPLLLVGNALLSKDRIHIFPNKTTLERIVADTGNTKMPIKCNDNLCQECFPPVLPIAEAASAARGDEAEEEPEEEPDDTPDEDPGEEEVGSTMSKNTFQWLCRVIITNLFPERPGARMGGHTLR